MFETSPSHAARHTLATVFAALVILALPGAGTLNGAAADPPAPRAPLLTGMGDHHHEISTDVPLAQRFFDQGLVLHFGFNHAEAVRSFREAARLDPECAVCFAGVALSLGPNINAQMDAEAAAPAAEAVARALELAPGAGERDRAYVAAIARRYAADPAAAPGPGERAGLDRAYAEAMGEVARRFPGDDDAAALHSEALMVLHPWDYWQADGDPKAWTPEILDVLGGVLERNPGHVFANHLMIHAVEASTHPERGLPSAHRLATAAPGAGHLVHMPSHVYIRTGDYHRASRANQRAIAADEEYLAQVTAQGAYPLAYAPHNHHFLWATATLEGRSELALAAAREVSRRADREMMRKPGFGTLQHFYSIPYYARVSFGRWDEILAAPAADEDLLYPAAAQHYARGMARANRGGLDAAREHLAALRRAAADPELEEVTIWDINSTASLVEIAAQILASEIAGAEGDREMAIAHLRRAVELEDALSYDEPPPWGPATRRYLGAALLEAGRPAEAEAVYRRDLESFPDNGWSLYGLLESLRAQGRGEEAREVEARFLHAWRHADVALTASRL